MGTLNTGNTILSVHSKSGVLPVYVCTEVRSSARMLHEYQLVSSLTLKNHLHYYFSDLSQRSGTTRCTSQLEHPFSHTEH